MLLAPLAAVPGEGIISPPPDADGLPLFKLRGRIDADFLWPDQTEQNRQTYGELNPTAGLRRARIGAEGHFTEDSRYVAEIDLPHGDVILRDVYVGVRDGSPLGEFKFGHMREPFSLEGATSANSFAFLERSPINTLDPARNWGLGFTRTGTAENWTLAGGIFQAGTDPSDLEFNPGSTSAVTLKATGLAWYEAEGRRLMHFGLAISERIPDQGLIRINETPRSPLLDLGDSSHSAFVPQLKIPANFQQIVNAQWALVEGSLWSQAEWYGSWIDQRGGGPVFYHGCHVDLGYFVTGEQRRYLTNAGAFGPVSVHRPVIAHFSSKQEPEDLGFGAWELTARFSYLDFIDLDAPPNDQGQPTGIQLPQTTLGLNWYLADRMRLMFNYTSAVPDEVNTGASAASVFGMRLGVYW